MVIQGTNALEQWRFNVNIAAAPYAQKYWAHKGAVQATERIWASLRDYVSIEDHVVFVGHSMGGTIAGLLALKRPDVFEAVSFGSPPVLKPQNVPEAPVLNVLDAGDIVPFVTYALGYRFAGDVYVIDPGPNLRYIPNFDAFMKSMGLGTSFKNALVLDNHYSNTYATSMTRLTKVSNLNSTYLGSIEQ